MTNDRFKEKLKKLDSVGLEKILEEKQLELLNINKRLFRGNKRWGYTQDDANKGNVSQIKKQIAIIKTRLKAMRVDVSEI